ncbi:unnamed protein product [Cuscuta epithymum]|uniref:Transmembrane protein n=1 Tax=Cuscuta epithymum TaxID=186058 RepID=A0AAV0F3T2_9ASTE|nr:unnamed protein product [Cuscuta epithymum]
MNKLPGCFVHMATRGFFNLFSIFFFTLSLFFFPFPPPSFSFTLRSTLSSNPPPTLSSSPFFFLGTPISLWPMTESERNLDRRKCSSTPHKPVISFRESIAPSSTLKLLG